MPHAKIPSRPRIALSGRIYRISKIGRISVAAAIAAIVSISVATATEAMDRDAVSIEESADRFVIDCDPGSQRLEVRVSDRTVSVATKGHAAEARPASDAEALLYDETHATVSIHFTEGEVPDTLTIGPIDRCSWTRLQVFILDQPGLGTGPLAQRSATALQISFPSSPESMLAIDAAGTRLFVQPAGAKGFATDLSNVRSLTFTGADGSLVVDLDVRGQQTSVELRPMTAVMWELLTAFVESHEELHLTLGER